MSPLLHPILLAAALAGDPVPEAGGYAYVPGDRRDPFRSPRTAAVAVESGTPSIDAVSLRGIVKSHGRYIALLVAPDGRTLTVGAGHRFADGVLESIDAGGATFRQELRDPLSPVKSRSVRKSL